MVERPAGFETCWAGTLRIGRAWICLAGPAWERAAGLETGDTADWDVGATRRLPSAGTRAEFSQRENFYHAGPRYAAPVIEVFNSVSLA